MEKLPRVEYDLDFGPFGETYMSLEDNGEYSTMMQETVYTKQNRPMESIDAIFERKMSKRLAKFHAKPIDRTQYDKELLLKQLDLEIIIVSIEV
jgi:hypothetical protein